MGRYDWGNVLERAAWTAVQVPAAMAIGEAFAGGDVVSPAMLWGALAGAVLSALKTVAQDRLRHLEADRGV